MGARLSGDWQNCRAGLVVAPLEEINKDLEEPLVEAPTEQPPDTSRRRGARAADGGTEDQSVGGGIQAMREDEYRQLAEQRMNAIEELGRSMRRRSSGQAKTTVRCSPKTKPSSTSAKRKWWR